MVVVPEEVWSGVELEMVWLLPVVLVVDESVDEVVAAVVGELVSDDDETGEDVLLVDVVPVDDVSVGCVASEPVVSDEVEKN